MEVVPATLQEGDGHTFPLLEDCVMWGGLPGFQVSQILNSYLISIPQPLQEAQTITLFQVAAGLLVNSAWQGPESPLLCKFLNSLPS